VLAVSEEEIISWGDNSDKSLYFVAKGDCIVKLMDSRGREAADHKLLSEGMHFGEISAIYNCPRTATVISRNFNTMGRVSYIRYRDLVNEYPDL